VTHISLIIFTNVTEIHIDNCLKNSEFHSI